MENNEIKKEEQLNAQLNPEQLDDANGGLDKKRDYFPIGDYCSCPQCGQSRHWFSTTSLGKQFKCPDCRIKFSWIYKTGTVEILYKY